MHTPRRDQQPIGKSKAIAVAAACLMLVAMGGPAIAQTPSSKSKPRAVTCPPTPKPVRDLDIPRFYANREGSAVDPDLATKHAAAVAPLVDFLRSIVDAADKAVARQDTARAACALTSLETWAAADAWQGDMVTQQAEYQRKWDLAGIALAYLKLKPHATPAQRAVIEPWLLRWSAKARAFFDNPARTRNNHWYWLGLATMATAIAAESDTHWQTARSIYDDALLDIRADGSLPKELERQQRALFYHVFAVTPLVVMAELAAARGEDWYGRQDGALHRLIALCMKGLQDPRYFEALSGIRQEQPVNPRAGWLSLYKARFPERLPAGRLPDVPDKHRWLGGDVHNLPRSLPQPAQRH